MKSPPVSHTGDSAALVTTAQQPHGHPLVPHLRSGTAMVRLCFLLAALDALGAALSLDWQGNNTFALFGHTTQGVQLLRA